MRPRLRGATPSTVRAAIESGDPFPGTRGFAGALERGSGGDDNPVVVRDVLGRQPVYTERDDPGRWAFDPADLVDPDLVPAGHVRTDAGDERVLTLPDPDPVLDEDVAVERVRAAVRESVATVDTTGLAVAFSGGVDSVAVASAVDSTASGGPDVEGGGNSDVEARADVAEGVDGDVESGVNDVESGVDADAGDDSIPLYVAGFEGSHDVDAARSAAAALGRTPRVIDLSHDDLERAIRAVAAATGRTDAMDVQIAVPLYLVAERVAADGYDRLAIGQGADELFGGYAKVASAPDDDRVEAETVRGARREVVETLPDQFERDVLTLRAAGVEPVAPLLDDRVIEAALELPESLILGADEQRKVAFRRAVREWVPDDVADREKKALQYGSLAARELDRMARQAGFKRRLNDHVTKYVESLVES